MSVVSGLEAGLTASLEQRPVAGAQDEENGATADGRQTQP
jgi:hypothetical protein